MLHFRSDTSALRLTGSSKTNSYQSLKLLWEMYILYCVWDGCCCFFTSNNNDNGDNDDDDDDAGNMSILPFYFRNNGPVLITNESLVAELELTSQGRIWEIRISGTRLIRFGKYHCIKHFLSEYLRAVHTCIGDR